MEAASKGLLVAFCEERNCADCLSALTTCRHRRNGIIPLRPILLRVITRFIAPEHAVLSGFCFGSVRENLKQRCPCIASPINYANHTILFIPDKYSI